MFAWYATNNLNKIISKYYITSKLQSHLFIDLHITQIHLTIR